MVVQEAGFDRMLKHVMDKEPTQKVYQMIQHMEDKMNARDGQAAAARASKNKQVNPEVARSKVLLDTKYIPNLVLML